MSINWGTVATSTVVFVLIIVLKIVLDLRLAPWLVKILYWLPVRNYFREKPIRLNGDWEHLWEHGGSTGFSDPIDRHGHTLIRQMGSYIYAEFYSQAKKYAFFGQIRDNFVVGDWFDVKDRAGYFGVFQLEIIDSATLKGLWLGHSKTSKAIRSDSSKWRKVGR